MERLKRTTAVRLAIMAGIAVVLALLYWFNPVETGFAPKCLFKQFTGLSCAGCGMQRFLHAFLNGRFAEAIAYNYMLVVLLPYLVLFGIERLLLTGTTQKRWRAALENKYTAAAGCTIGVGWFIVRNILNI